MADGFAPYRAILASRLRSQLTYRTSFAMDLLGSLAIGLLEFAEVYIIFAQVDVLGELDFAGAVLLFALANIGFSVADLVVGHIDTIPTYIRTGTLDAFLLRPLPVLAQLITSDLQLRRLGRTAFAVAILFVALPLNDIDWDAGRVVLLVLTPVTGAAIFAALFVCAAALQFWLVEGREFANAFTYGGSYAAGYPTSIFTLPMRVLFTFVVPAAFTAYLPTLALLGLPGPFGTPSWLGWLTPLAAIGIWGVALLAWRAGLRHYTGAGS
ncbi:protein of unknown function DUF990 [Beutenbergia cavernae DSM 12333]|uniref:ABC transporter permease protein n=1 Tax=Beutenbergia cavernae (strain ATCC BAA-8 / DSM 12333 / CCUG 43141 / JCM 11478 / NBRC 16432 / NCIMB 13614 / HKI 0122) TaxID=471853 RepID=C5C0K0_BEUC1|nr:ABC-2 family transporter protein [Beutenbergia cavernae]ACQ81396.1 protein of unknown function DUF990 [Beutenbergia cavernae DSM 12333]